MKKKEALAEIDSVGYAYFYDAPSDISDSEILNQISENIVAAGPGAISFWHKTLEAFKYVLRNLTDPELDELLIHVFNRSSSRVADPRDFLTKVEMTISEAIDEVHMS
jgi:hypothetical protein